MRYGRGQHVLGHAPWEAGGALLRHSSSLSLRSHWSSAQQTVEVVIQKYRFEPAEVQIRAGDTVKWINQEKRTSHSVLFAPEQGGESERFFPGESWQRKFDAPGRYVYSCGPHPEMKGVVEVVAP
jgi:plastocyanin